MKTNLELWQSWQNLMSALNLPIHESTYKKLIAAYSEPHRYYHNLQHLKECLGWAEQVRPLLIRPAEVELALWFHDAIYQPHSSSNEIDSAAWAKRFLSAAGADGAIANRIVNYILATQNHASSDNLDCQFVLDIDLAILGSYPERFKQFKKQIRQEYDWVSLSKYQQKRAIILQHFLARETIYQTRFFYEQHETQARKNICWAIAKLKLLNYSDSK